jgi:hypothetical protein
MADFLSGSADRLGRVGSIRLRIKKVRYSNPVRNTNYPDKTSHGIPQFLDAGARVEDLCFRLGHVTTPFVDAVQSELGSVVMRIRTGL